MIKMYQDRVEVMVLPDGAKCQLDDQRRSPLELEVCPLGYEYCSGECVNYQEV